MNLSLMVGLLGGFVLIIVSCFLAGSIKAFLDFNSFLIVLGGSIASIFVAYPADAIKSCMKSVSGVMKRKNVSIKSQIDSFIKYSEAVRKNGRMALEQFQTSDAFLKKGLTFVLDNKSPDMLHEMLAKEKDAFFESEIQGPKVLEKLGDYCPAWGMVGTLIGLVVMMLNLSDPSAIGPSMAVALITTFYGALFANLVFLPLAQITELRVKENDIQRDLTIQGILSLSREEGPRVMEERLMAYVYHDPKYLKQLMKEVGVQNGEIK